MDDNDNKIMVEKEYRFSTSILFLIKKHHSLMRLIYNISINKCVLKFSLKR